MLHAFADAGAVHLLVKLIAEQKSNRRQANATHRRTNRAVWYDRAQRRRRGAAARLGGATATTKKGIGAVHAAKHKQGSQAQHRDKGSFQHWEGSFEGKLGKMYSIERLVSFLCDMLSSACFSYLYHSTYFLSAAVAVAATA